MQTPTAFLSAIVKAVLASLDAGAATSTVRVDAKMNEKCWQEWAPWTPEAERPAELVALARATLEELDAAAAGVLSALAGGAAPKTVGAVRGYLRYVPVQIRAALRRPADPSGTSAPQGWRIREARDLGELLAARSPWFDIGDRPLGIGDWELVDLLELGLGQESWKAQNFKQPEDPPALLQFLQDPDLKDRLRKLSLEPWENVRKQTAQPGWVRLRQVHVQADPPCLEWSFVPSGDLRGLVRQWVAGDTTGLSREIAELIQMLAKTLATAHDLQPPLVHGALAAAVVHASGEAGRWTSQIGALGLSALNRAGEGLIQPTVYSSPQQLRGQPLDPRDDVFALGILWFQLLSRDADVGRPTGSQWRRRLLDEKVPSSHLELVEICCAEDARARPADAGELVKRLDALLQVPAEAAPRPDLDLASMLQRPASQAAGEPAAAGGVSSSRESSLRPRSRRADVRQLFQSLEQDVKERPKLFSNSVGMKLVLLPAGTFWMGSPPDEAGRRDNEGPRHEVLLSNGLYLAIHTVTQAQFQRIMGRNPSRFDVAHGGGADYPVENATWEDAVEFCRRLSALPEEKAAGRKYRLPTEAEWEYACRAGSETPFAFGAALSAAQANFNGNFPFGGADRGDYVEKTMPVGSFTPNNFGLGDLHGNVWEWCADWLGSDYYGRSPKRNPQGPDTGQFRVLRGGSWQNHAVSCRSAYRNGLSPRSRDHCTGFRVAADVE
jgi:formylglycine-generating enzyme required for sulfatase activity